jgi:hypothetical protein
MEKLIESLKIAYPDLNFTPGNTFCWSPETGEVFYKATEPSEHQVWSLLHETGHALLKHTQYKADLELVRMEVVAWQKAQELAKLFGTIIDEDHIQNCLDTYRDWLYRRSICPSCTTKCLQQSDMNHYRCFNCHTTWKVTPSRFCRSYRSVKNIKKPISVLQATEDF